MALNYSQEEMQLIKAREERKGEEGIKEQRLSIVGVDTHSDTLACYCDGKFKEFKTNEKGFKEALNWAKDIDKDCVFAIEGAYCFGLPFSSFLTKEGCRVYDINPLLTKNWRSALKVANPKNDYGDAKVISLFANMNNMNEVSLKAIKLKEKLTARKSLIKQRVQITNQVKMLFKTRGDKLPFDMIETNKGVKWLLNYGESNNDVIIKTNAIILRTLMDSIKEIEEDLKKALDNELPPQVKKLTELKGLSTILAITIYTETKGKLYTKSKFASFCGVAPIEYSSGKSQKRKNNKGGNRMLNSVFYTLSIHQKRYNPVAKEYYERKLKEGKTPRHARKCLARQLCNIVFNILSEDVKDSKDIQSAKGVENNTDIKNSENT